MSWASSSASRPLRLSKGLRRRGVLRISPQSPRREGQRDARVGHQLTDDRPPLLRIAPVDFEAALEAGGEMPAQPLRLHDLLSLPALEPAGLVHDVPDPIRDQVVGVAHGAASENGRRVDRGRQRRALQQARRAARLDPAIEDLTRRLVEHQLRTEALQRALRAELLVQLQAQRHLPPQVVGAASDRLLVRDGIMRL